MTTYATLDPGASLPHAWLARILETGKEPYYFQPHPLDWIETKGDLVRLVNKAYPGVTYCHAETFNALIAQQEAHS